MQTATSAAPPILIVGGFLTDPIRYEQFGLALGNVSASPVFVAPIGLPDWLWASLQDDFSGLLRRFAGTVKSVLRQTNAARLTIVGHSAGGILARLFMGDQPYGPQQIAYAGHRVVNQLVTVGTPHSTVRSGRQGGLNQVAWVMQRYPGAYWPDVEYVTVMGTGIEGHSSGTFAARAAFASYRLFDGRGDQVGDGIVPLSCGLLEGARHILLPDVHHGPRAFRPWYGENEAVIRRWWN